LRSLVRAFVTFGTADAVGRLSVLLTLPIYARVLGPDGLGKLAYLSTAVQLLTGLLSLGIEQAYARCHPAARGEDERQRLTSTYFVLAVAWAAVCVVVALPFAELLAIASFGTAADAVLWLIALGCAAAAALNGAGAQVLRSESRLRPYFVLSVSGTVLAVALGLAGVLKWGLGVAGVLGGLAIAGAVVFLARMWHLRPRLRPVFETARARELLAIGVPTISALTAYWGFNAADRILLGWFGSLEAVGHYNVAATFAGALLLAINALWPAWQVYALKAWEDGEPDHQTAYARVATYALAGFGAMALAVTTWGPELVALFAGAAFAEAAAAIAPIALGLAIYALSPIVGIGISIKRRFGLFMATAWAAAAVNAALNVILIPRLGMMGSAYAALISYGVLTGANLVIGQRLWPFALERYRLAATAVLIVAFVTGATFLPANAAFLKSGYVAAFVALLFAARVFDAREFRALRASWDAWRARL
jgi:O-antigen/teichoic acid export membrane protein